MRARTGTQHGRRVGVQPELDPSSVARCGRGARKQMTGGPHPSATEGGAHGDGGERAAQGREILLGRCARERGWAGREVGFLFFYFYPLPKTSKQI
jgi:hypothetical protein